MKKKKCTLQKKIPLPKNRYLLDESDYWQISDLCSGLQLVLEKLILRKELPRYYSWDHPVIKGYEEFIQAELERKDPLPKADAYFTSTNGTN